MNQKADNFIAVFIETFEKIFDLTDKISKIAVYYNLKYPKSNKDALSTSEVSYNEFKSYHESKGVFKKVIEEFLKNIDFLRKDEYANKLILRQVVEKFVSTVV